MAQTIDVVVPDLGDFSDVEIIEVLVAPGDELQADDSVIVKFATPTKWISMSWQKRSVSCQRLRARAN